jgi:hypothetical protein
VVFFVIRGRNKGRSRSKGVKGGKVKSGKIGGRMERNICGRLRDPREKKLEDRRGEMFLTLLVRVKKIDEN